MKKLILAFAFVMSFVMSVNAAESLNADFVNTDGKKIGTAILQKSGNGTLITLDLWLPEGVHGLHIHENAMCDPPDFKSAGGHFNPEGHKHGFDNPEGSHAGDLPNLYVESTNHIKTEIFYTQLPLWGPEGLVHGGSLIVHEKADDYSTDPSGNAGSRIACAILKANND